MNKNKEEFIKNEIFLLTIMGAFARNNIYKNSVSENERLQFRNDIKSILLKLEERYRNKLPKIEHLSVLSKFKKDIDNKGKNILKESSISFGTAQKLVNLYLKYLWCIGFIEEPPSCPIDSIILKKIKDYKTRWTTMTEEQYKLTIKKIEQKKGDKSIANWELEEFSRK